MRAEISIDQSFVRCLGSEHATLNREMNAFESLGIQESSRIARDHPAIARERRDGEPSAIRHRLGSVANHLPAIEQSTHERMSLECLHHMVRIKPRIFVIKSGDETERNDVISASVN